MGPSCRHDKRGYVPDTVVYGIIMTLEALKCRMLSGYTTKCWMRAPNIYTYTSLIKCLCHDDRLPEAVTLFKQVIEEGLTPDRIFLSLIVSVQT